MWVTSRPNYSLENYIGLLKTEQQKLSIFEYGNLSLRVAINISYEAISDNLKFVLTALSILSFHNYTKELLNGLHLSETQNATLSLHIAYRHCLLEYEIKKVDEGFYEEIFWFHDLLKLFFEEKKGSNKIEEDILFKYLMQYLVNRLSTPFSPYWFARNVINIRDSIINIFIKHQNLASIELAELFLKSLKENVNAIDVEEDIFLIVGEYHLKLGSNEDYLKLVATHIDRLEECNLHKRCIKLYAQLESFHVNRFDFQNAGVAVFDASVVYAKIEDWYSAIERSKKCIFYWVGNVTISHELTSCFTAN